MVTVSRGYHEETADATGRIRLHGSRVSERVLAFVGQGSPRLECARESLPWACRRGIPSVPGMSRQTPRRTPGGVTTNGTATSAGEKSDQGPETSPDTSPLVPVKR